MSVAKKLKELDANLSICQALIKEIATEIKLEGEYPKILNDVLHQIYSRCGGRWNHNKNYSLDYSEWIKEYLKEVLPVGTVNYQNYIRLGFRYNKGKKRWVVYYRNPTPSRIKNIIQDNTYFKQRHHIKKAIDPLVNKLNLSIQGTSDPYELFIETELSQLNGLWRGIKDFQRIIEHKENLLLTRKKQAVE